jgi:hypothetical protein
MQKRSDGFRLLRISFLLSLFFLFSMAARAQSTATLQGTVTDSKGAVIPNATVTVRNQATSLVRTAQTDSSGTYQLAALPAGVYTVEVQATGFGRQVINDLSIEVARTVVKDFQVQIGSLEQTVSISADAPVIESATISVGQVINQRTVQEIPLNGRHFVDLGLLIPGSVTPPQNGFLTAPLRGQGSFGLNTAGGREDTVNFMINGVNLNDMVQNQITFQPSINTVAEFKMDNSTFSAEYGRNSGAIVNIATRGGSNKFHGELFEFLRNNALDARNFFDAVKPKFRRNQFGANIGGPIIKNKTFFFFSYEGLRQRQGLTLVSSVLTDAQRATATVNGNATVLKLLPLIPVANANDPVSGVRNRFTGSGTAPVNLNQETIDITHSISTKDHLHGYYAFQKDLRGEPGLQGNNVPGFGDTRQSNRQIMTINETHTFGANTVNEVRFGFNRIHITFTPNFQVSSADFNIDNGVTKPIGLPQISITGGINIGGPSGFPQGRTDSTFVLSDTLSYLHGNHSFKFGGEFRRFHNDNFTSDPGTFTFANVANFILAAPVPASFAVTKGDRPSTITQRALGLYVQDNYKWRPNVTVELGLRYDWNMTPTESQNRFVIFDVPSRSLVQIGSNGLKDVYHQNSRNFEPRVGISWDPFKNGKTSVRAAYAILADQPVTNVVTPLTANPPLATPLSITTGVYSFNNAATVAGNAGLAPNAIDPNLNNAYIQSWNLNVQREVRPGFAVTAGYYGSKGTHLRTARNINQPVNGVFANRPFPTLSATSPIRPGATLNAIAQIESSGISSYNALWLTANKRFGRGLQFNASYTWSKSIDYTSLNSQGVILQDSYNERLGRGLSDFDARHRFVVSGIYELPFKGNQLVEGWQLSTIVQAQSGNPVTIVVNNAAFTGNNNTLRPDVTGPITILGTAVRWFDTSVFAVPVGRFGSLGRNVVIGPRFNNTDFSIIKRIKLSESKLIEFRAEFFDLFNHANFGQPGRVVGSATFGQITNTRFATGDSGSSRQMQFALKFKF